MGLKSVVAILLLALMGGGLDRASSGPDEARPLEIPLTSTQNLLLLGMKAEIATHRGRRALHLKEEGSGEIVLVPGTEFRNGTIEVDVAGAPAANARPDMRGFIGVVFRSQADASKFEYFYIRPTNGRADDQLRRNHATQYASFPDFPWDRLRKETPGVYESYVDLEPAVWTRLRVVVDGTKARLYVNGAGQPCLIVNDLKLGESSGLIGFWIGDDTDGYFTNLKITRAK